MGEESVTVKDAYWRTYKRGQGYTNSCTYMDVDVERQTSASERRQAVKGEQSLDKKPKIALQCMGQMPRTLSREEDGQ